MYNFPVLHKKRMYHETYKEELLYKIFYTVIHLINIKKEPIEIDIKVCNTF